MVDLLFVEVRGAQLGDVRLNERLVRIVERFGESPNLSIPAAARSRAEMEAAYRFFSNENVSPEKILTPHAVQTLRRIAEQPVVPRCPCTRMPVYPDARVPGCPCPRILPPSRDT